MGSRLFDGTNNWWNATENYAAWNGCTFAAIIRPAANTGTTRDVCRMVGTPNSFFRVDGSNRVGLATNGSVAINAAVTVLAANGWQGVAATKATGAVAPTLYRTILSTGTTVSGVGSTTATDPAAGSSGIVVGSTSGIAGRFNGNIFMLGIWARELSAAEVALLWTGRGPWYGTNGLNDSQRVTLCLGNSNAATAVNYISGVIYTDQSPPTYVPDLPPGFTELETPLVGGYKPVVGSIAGTYTPEVIPGG